MRRKAPLVRVEGRTRRTYPLDLQLDDLCRAIVFLRDGRVCRRCHLPRVDIQCHHIVTRGKRSMRWDPRNCLTLCFTCHILWWHQNATAQEQLDFLHQTIGEQATALLFLRKRLRAGPVDMQLVKAWLNKAMNDMLLRLPAAPFPGDPTAEQTGLAPETLAP